MLGDRSGDQLMNAARKKLREEIGHFIKQLRAP